MKKARKKNTRTKVLIGNIATGTIFIGDIGFMGANSQDYPEGIPADPANPFKDTDSFLASFPSDSNLELPGSFNGDLPGRGVIVHSNMLNGKYTVKKKLDKATGKLLEIKVRFHE